MRVSTAFLTGLALLSVGGCTSMPISNWPEYQKPPAADEARIIVSGARRVNCGSTIFHLGVSRPGANAGDTLSRIAEATVDGDLPSDFKYESGKVSVISLKPGTYVVYPILAFALFGGSRSDLVRPPQFQFEAKAGEVTYIGELFIDGPCEDSSGATTLKDQEARDVAVVTGKNPAFSGVPIVKRLATPIERRPD